MEQARMKAEKKARIEEELKRLFRLAEEQAEGKYGDDPVPPRTSAPLIIRRRRGAADVRVA
jgi:hypothetical protein